MHVAESILNAVSCEIETNRNMSLSQTPHKTATYSQIDIILDRMLDEVEQQEQNLFGLDLDVLEPRDSPCINTLELIPSADALIEVPIKKSIKIPKRHPKVYETTQTINVRQSDESPYELISFGESKEESQPEEHEYDLIQFEESKKDVKTLANEVISVPVEGDEACFLLSHADDQYFEKPYTSNYTLEFSKATTASAESLNDRTSTPDSQTYQRMESIDPEEHDYEPIDTQHINDFGYQLHENFTDSSDIWWEGTYRNLSIVPEEDEENLSMLSSLYSNPNKYDHSRIPHALEEHVPLVDSRKSSTDDESSSSTSTSADEGTYDLREKVVKAEVKLMVKTTERGRENIEIRSVREFMDDTPKKTQAPEIVKQHRQKSQTLPSRLGEKFTNFGNKVSSFLDLNKRSSSHTALVVLSDNPEEVAGTTINVPSFTLPRVFIKPQEEEIFQIVGLDSLLSTKELSKSKSELIATTKEIFPLQFDHTRKVDLYANPPFYPIYDDCEPLLQRFHSSSPVPIHPSPAYCDWFSQPEDSIKGKVNVLNHNCMVFLRFAAGFSSN